MIEYLYSTAFNIFITTLFFWKTICVYCTRWSTKSNGEIDLNKLRTFISTLHAGGIIVATMLTEYDKTTLNNIGNQLAIKNTILHNIVMSYSLTYFIIDLSMCIISNDTMFVFHHIISAIACFSIICKGYGGILALQILGAAECSTPLLNFGKFLSKKNIKPYYFLPVWFVQTFFFLYLRCIVISRLVFIYAISQPFCREYFLVMFVMFFISIGSIIWIKKQIHGIKKKLICYNYL